MNRKQAEHDRTVLPRIQELKAEGRSLRGIAEQLQRDGVPTARRGGQWTHIAVGRILDRAERTPPEEASPPPPQAEPPPSPTEPPQAEPLPVPTPPHQESEAQPQAQHEATLQQLSTRYQEALQREMGSIVSVTAQEAKAVRHVVVRLWFWFAVGGVLLIGSLTLGTWGLAAGLTASIESKLQERDALKVEIEQQQATLRELEKHTWGVGFHDTTGGKYITWPGHYRQPFQGKDSDPGYAGKWVAKLAEE